MLIGIEPVPVYYIKKDLLSYRFLALNQDKLIYPVQAFFVVTSRSFSENEHFFAYLDPADHLWETLGIKSNNYKRNHSRLTL